MTWYVLEPQQDTPMIAQVVARIDYEHLIRLCITTIRKERLEEKSLALRLEREDKPFVLPTHPREVSI